MEGGQHMKELLLICAFILLGLARNYALTYDYSASIECLPNPQEPQYGGGIIRNPKLDEGLQGWSPFGGARIDHRESRGNNYLVAHSRNKPNESVSQKLYLEQDNLYIISSWLQVNGDGDGGDDDVLVAAVFKTENGLKHAGAAIVKSNCWSMLKGGFTAESSGPAELYFESNNTSVEIWVDSVSLLPFTKEQWKSHQYQSMEQTRKRKVKLQAVDEQGKPLANCEISIKQKSSSIPIGCTINPNILTNLAYQNWYLPRFKYATLEDQMKWYVNEPVQGKEDYAAADALIQFAQQHGISVRGHNVHWDNPSLQPSWVHSLSPTQLNEAVARRQRSIMTRYKNKVISWDVVNENVHFSFFESKLGHSASASIYKVAHDLDATAIPFMNEFGTIEDTKDVMGTPVKYIQRLKEIQSFPGYSGWPIGIGLEGHFSNLDMAYMRASLDMLGASGMPIWLTELDVNSQPNQAQFLDETLREALSHPKVQGIIIWAAWKPEGCYRMCLTDNNFNNLPTGDVVDKILKEIGSNRLRGKTDANGLYEASFFHGDYEVEISHSSLPNSTIGHHFSVVPSDDDLNITKMLLKANVSSSSKKSKKKDSQDHHSDGPRELVTGIAGEVWRQVASEVHFAVEDCGPSSISQLLCDDQCSRPQSDDRLLISELNGPVVEGHEDYPKAIVAGNTPFQESGLTYRVNFPLEVEPNPVCVPPHHGHSPISSVALSLKSFDLKKPNDGYLHIYGL
ncbi:hypothetical protein K1719_000842 [Acacia pycnantha]|nr:hypothetical protein K1719_000842 [Acacia pycnantha]